jgi:hypothetical protein
MSWPNNGKIVSVRTGERRRVRGIPGSIARPRTPRLSPKRFSGQQIGQSAGMVFSISPKVSAKTPAEPDFKAGFVSKNLDRRRKNY